MSEGCNDAASDDALVGELSVPTAETLPDVGRDAWDYLNWRGAAIVLLAWLAIYVYLASQRGDDAFGFGFMLTIGWLVACVGLAGLWVVVAVVAIRARVRRNALRARRAAAFLIPFPIAVALAIFLGANDLPLRARFELSKGSLNHTADAYEQTHEGDFSGWVGLYHVDHVQRWENCTVVVTGRFIFDEYGFARCDGAPPQGDNPWNIRLKPFDGDWWIYDDLD